MGFTGGLERLRDRGEAQQCEAEPVVVEERSVVWLRSEACVEVQSCVAVEHCAVLPRRVVHAELHGRRRAGKSHTFGSIQAVA